jgi:hypothetical protein
MTSTLRSALLPINKQSEARAGPGGACEAKWRGGLTIQPVAEVTWADVRSRHASRFGELAEDSPPRRPRLQPAGRLA